jgi:hypothetical protein
VAGRRRRRKHGPGSHISDTLGARPGSSYHADRLRSRPPPTRPLERKSAGSEPTCCRSHSGTSSRRTGSKSPARGAGGADRPGRRGAACAGSYLRPSDRHTDRSRWDRKTRLALETAHILSPDLDGAVWVVELGSLSDAGLIAAAVASVLGLHFRGSDISPAALALAIGGRRLLLVIDNCEHVIDAAARVVETMVRLCPEVSVLATSREHMRIDGETTCKDGAHPAG